MTGNDLLLVIDVQNGSVNPHSKHIVEPLCTFVEKWLAQGNQAIFTRFINDPDSQWEKLMHWSRVRIEPEISLVPRLAEMAISTNKQVTIVDKHSYSSLTPEVKSIITRSASSRILLCGIATDACVLKTAVDLFEARRTPLVLVDLCASEAGAIAHRAGLIVIERLIGAEQMIVSGTITSGDINH